MDLAKEPLGDKRHVTSVSKCDIQLSQSLRPSQRTVSENCESEEEHNTNTAENMKLERETSKSPSNSSVSIAGNELGVNFAISPACTSSIHIFTKHKKLPERVFENTDHCNQVNLQIINCRIRYNPFYFGSFNIH